MSRNITPISNTDFVEEWFNKTNLIIDAVQNTVTIGDAEINTGNVVLAGDFSATNLAIAEIGLVDELADTIPYNARMVANTTALFPVTINSPSPLPEGGSSTIAFASEDSTKWEIGAIDNTYETFAIKNSDSGYSLTLTADDQGRGVVSGVQVIIDKSILPTTIDSNTTGDAGTCTKWKTPRTVSFATGDVQGSFTIDGSSNLDNVVLNVQDNSHRHEISNIEGLDDALAAKQTFDPAVDSISQLGTQFGILARTSQNTIKPIVIANGEGIVITNGGGVSGTPTIGHADTSSAEGTENSGSTFIQNIGLDKFGHVTSVTSQSVPMSATYEVERSFQGGTKAEISHGLGRRPFLVEGYLVCKDNDAGYVVGDMVSLGTATSDITVYATGTDKIAFRCKNVVTANVINSQGQSVTINNTKWKLLIKGVV